MSKAGDLSHNHSVGGEGEDTLIAVPDDGDVVPLAVVDGDVGPVADELLHSRHKFHDHARVRGLEQDALVLGQVRASGVSSGRTGV